MEPVSDSTSGEDLGALLESTLTLSRGLETLYSEHKVLLETLGEGGEASSRKAGRELNTSHSKVKGIITEYERANLSPGPHSSDEVDSEDFAEQVKIEKTAALGHSLGLLRAGIDEAKVCSRSLEKARSHTVALGVCTTK